MIKRKKLIGSIVIFLIFTLAVLILYIFPKLNSNNKNEEMSIYSENVISSSINAQNKNAVENGIDTSTIKKEIKAQIYGEINKPGVYSLKLGDRVKDLINAAGGFTEMADCFSINGAKRLVDGDNIEIKSKNDTSISKSKNSVTGDKASTSMENLEKLDINSATLEDIINKKIPGIGKGYASKIIQYREKSGGRINSQKDLESAIGVKRTEKIMDYISIN